MTYKCVIGSFHIILCILCMYQIFILHITETLLCFRFEFDALEYGQVSEMAILNLKWEYVNLGCCRVEMAALGKLFKYINNNYNIYMN